MGQQKHPTSRTAPPISSKTPHVPAIYAAWLRGYIALGGRVKHECDFPMPVDRWTVIEPGHGTRIDGAYECGAFSRRILVLDGGHAAPVNFLGPFGGWGHTKVYWLDDFRTNAIGPVVIWSDPEFDEFRDDPGPADIDRLRAVRALRDRAMAATIAAKVHDAMSAAVYGEERDRHASRPQANADATVVAHSADWEPNAIVAAGRGWRWVCTCPAPASMVTYRSEVDARGAFLRHKHGLELPAGGDGVKRSIKLPDPLWGVLPYTSSNAVLGFVGVPLWIVLTLMALGFIGIVSYAVFYYRR